MQYIVIWYYPERNRINAITVPETGGIATFPHRNEAIAAAVKYPALQATGAKYQIIKLDKEIFG